MARNHTTTKLFGATERTDLDGKRPPVWMTEFNSSVEKSIGEWAEDITQHKVVNVAYGEGEDTSDFDLSNSTRMVVTMNSGDEVATVSDRFNLVDNPRVVATAVDVIQNLDLEDVVFGEGRDYKNKFVVDLFFDDNDVVRESPDDTSAKMAYGVSISAANDKSSSVRVCPTIWDGHSETLIRGIGEGWKKVKHMKPENVESKDMYDQMAYMFTETLVSLEDVADKFTEQTEKAESFVVDFSLEDFNHSEFYETWLGDTVPQKVIDASVKQSQVRAGLIDEGHDPIDNPKISIWALVSGFTYSYTYESNISDGPQKRRYHQTARDALNTPEETVIQVRQDYVVAQKDSEGNDSEEEMTLEQKTATTQEELRQMKIEESA